MNWVKTADRLPEECHAVLAKLEDGSIIILTVITGEWVTDATVSEVYDSEPHIMIPDHYTPIEWAYLEEA
jgi:hypothetical protein